MLPTKCPYCGSKVAFVRQRVYGYATFRFYLDGSSIKENDGLNSELHDNLEYDITAIGWAMKDYLLSVEVIGNIHDNPELLEKIGGTDNA